MLRISFEAADDGFDPIKSVNLYSNWVGDAIYERLLGYDYVARPAKLVPMTAKAMPQVSSDGKTFVFDLKPGIHFSPDPAFKGKRRELTAQDYVYSIKRILDPANRSPMANFVEGKIVGLDALAQAAKKSGRYDYDAPVAGLRAEGRYTLRIVLNKPDHNFLFVVASGALGAVAREVIEAHGLQSALHPVGTGPYLLAQYVPRSKIVLAANPEYRGFTWNFQSGGSPDDDALVRTMQGKTMPQIGKVDISIIDEQQSRWLAFQDQQLDLDMLPQAVAPRVLDGNRLKKEFLDKGIAVSRYVEPEINYTFFNFRDPTVGGYTPDKIALRRAIAMSYSIADEIAQYQMGQAVKAEMIIPPGVIGHDPQYRSSIPYDVALANALLDKFGYKRGADGMRTLSDGKPLLIKLRTEANAKDKIRAEVWKRGLDRIGVRVEFSTSNFADNTKESNECKLMMRGAAWLPDIPDGENFLQLLYGRNALQGNYGCYQSPTYDALYREALSLPLGPQRTALYAKMARQFEADTPWVLATSRIRTWMMQPWVQGFKKHPVLQSTWQYMDIDLAERARRAHK
ncbi:MAG TPA: ABC transporter substrate-binding protein [Burkholderiaceae bacterium]